MLNRIATIIGTILIISLSLMALPINVAVGASPEVKPIPRQYILEGDELELVIEASDSDGDQIELGMVTRPAGAVFFDNGDGTGTLRWTTDFSGPNSSEGSPYNLTFWAGDGENTTVAQTEVIVINKNRKPQIVHPEEVSAFSGEELIFNVTGYDPDLDSVSWEMISAPEGLMFSDGNPGWFSWSTAYSDSGDYNVRVCLVDQYGASDTADIALSVLSTEVFGLSIDTISVYPGEYAKVNINLDNLESISGFNLVVNYDASVLTFSSIKETGTRTETFEYFTYQLNYRSQTGDILIVGVADIENGTDGGNIEPGSGPLAEMNFYVSNNLEYAGISVPVYFVFRDPVEQNDNSLADEFGVKIIPDQIVFENGYIKIKSASDNSLGDINLNGVAMEIGDAIYFTNYFIYPNLYPLNPVQWLNSDINQDGHGGTVADLVFMLNIIVNAGAGSSKLSPGGGVVSIGIDNDGDSFRLFYDSPVEMGGLALTLQGDNKLDNETVIRSSFEMSGITVKSAIDGSLIRLLIYAKDGQSMPSGLHKFIEIMNCGDLQIEDIQLSSADGFMIKSLYDDNPGMVLPGGFMLYQNYPNPFNPSTAISFDIPHSTAVNLTVYNLLGQEVKNLVNRNLPAGRHTIEWDGRDNLGRAVASGIYFYSLTGDTFSAREKMLLLK